MCVCVRARVFTCVRVCVCVRVCLRVHVCPSLTGHTPPPLIHSFSHFAARDRRAQTPGLHPIPRPMTPVSTVEVAVVEAAEGFVAGAAAAVAGAGG